MLNWPTTTFTVFVTIFILNSSVSLDIPSSLLCPSDWIYIKKSDKCIKGEQRLGTRDENFELCKNLNASMITIESAEENDEIYDELTKLHVLRFWIAGKTEGVSIDTKTIRTIVHLMKPTNYTNWGKGSPSCQAGEQCCIMVNTYKFWVDIECSEDEFFACEKHRIFESSEFNPVESMEDESPEELECSEKLLLDILAPKNMTKLDDTFAKMYNEIEINRAISKSISVTSSPKPPNSSSTVTSLNHSMPTSSSLISLSSYQPSMNPETNMYPSTESIVASSTPNPPVVTVSEELINHIIKRYQKDQLNVIRLWFELIRTHRNSSELSRQLQRSINKPTEGFQLSNYLLVMLTILSILVLVATIITLSIITRRFLRQKTQDTYQLSSRLLELGYNAYE